jgi:hypothetical protein
MRLLFIDEHHFNELSTIQQQQLLIHTKHLLNSIHHQSIYNVSRIKLVVAYNRSDTVENKVAPAATVEEVEDASEAKGKGKEVEAEATAADASADADKEENPYAGLSEEELNAKVVTLVAEGKKAVALKQWEEAVAKYGESLEVK